MKKSENLAASVIDAAKIACENGKASQNYTFWANSTAFKKLDPEKGKGKFLLHILKNPGQTKKQILAETYPNGKSQYNELFTVMRCCKLIENKKPGYYITDLGIALLQQFSLI